MNHRPTDVAIKKSVMLALGFSIFAPYSLGRQCGSFRAKMVGVQGRKPWGSWSRNRCRKVRDFASRPRIWTRMVKRVAYTDYELGR